jgi:hypothetical protein
MDIRRKPTIKFNPDMADNAFAKWLAAKQSLRD